MSRTLKQQAAQQYGSLHGDSSCLRPLSSDWRSPSFGVGCVSTSASASYNGKYGTENTVQDTSTVENSRTVACPPKTKCTLKLVASKLDDYNIPFTALVERTQDVGPPLQWQESGVWRGVQAFNFATIYCTTDLGSGATNCPQFDLM